MFHVENSVDGRFLVPNWLHAATLLQVLRCVFEKVVVCRFVTSRIITSGQSVSHVPFTGVVSSENILHVSTMKIKYLPFSPQNFNHERCVAITIRDGNFGSMVDQ